MLEVVREDLDRALGCVVGKIVSDLTFDGGGDETVVAVLNCLGNVSLCGAFILLDELAVEIGLDNIVGQLESDLEEALLLSSVDGEDAVGEDLLDLLIKIVILRVNRVLFLRGF